MECNWGIKNAAGDFEPANLACINVLLGNLVQALVMLAGLALFVMILIGGFNYLTSAGDAKKAESGRNTIFWAIVGIVVMVSSYAIIRAIEIFTGVEGLLEFRIPTS
jgi:hypothetical protein